MRGASSSALIALAMSVVLVATGVFFVGRWSVPLEERPGFAEPVVKPILVNPRGGELETVVGLRAEVRPQEVVSVTVPQDASAFRHVVTSVAAQPGIPVAVGDVLATVNGVPILLMRGEVPSYRILQVGDSGPDVAQLKANLENLGYAVERDDVLSLENLSQVQRFMSDRGFAQVAERLPATGVDTRMFVYVAHEPTRVLETTLVAAADVPIDGPHLQLGGGAVQLIVAPTRPGVMVSEGAEVVYSCGAVSGRGRVSGNVASFSAATPGSSAEAVPGDEVGHVVEGTGELSAARGQQCVATATMTQAAELSVPVSAVYSRDDGSVEVHVHTEGTSFTPVAVRLGNPVDGWAPIIDPPAILTPTTNLVVGSQR